MVSAGSGGILGIAGSLVSGFFKSRQRKQELAFKEKEWEQEIRMQELVIKAKERETENELAILETQGSYTGLSESIKADAAIGETHMIINDVKALFRPFLTISLWGISGWVFWRVCLNPNNILSDSEAIALIRYMVYSVFFCASTATTWWFGDRALNPPGFKLMR